jgi:hypothetical protein
MLAPLGLEYRTWISVIGIAQLTLGSGVVLLALGGYTKNRSRAMLLLGAGIASLTLLPVVVRYAFQPKLGLRWSTLVTMGLETVGLALILVSIVQARRA